MTFWLKMMPEWLITRLSSWMPPGELFNCPAVWPSSQLMSLSMTAQTFSPHQWDQNTPLMDAEVTWFTNGNSLIQDRQRYSGAAMVSTTKIIWAEPLLVGMSVQKPRTGSFDPGIRVEKIQETQISFVPLVLLISVAIFIGREAFWWQNKGLNTNLEGNKTT